MYFFGLPKRKVFITASDEPSSERISVILPVLNEAERIARCLDGLVAQPAEVGEILVVDGGSTDATQKIVEGYRALDSRVRLVDASPVDPLWTGKAWGLNIGLQRVDPSSQWILTVDADTSVAPQLARSLLAHVQKTGVKTFSVATRQHLSGKIEALIHPAMLATLVYRFGSPGRTQRAVHRVQANGQCFFSRRQRLLDTGAFASARTSLCEDITIVRRLAECGEGVGFYESDGLADVKMYDSWRETWNNWPRSLPMRDQYFGWRDLVVLSGVLFVQALPLPGFLLGLLTGAPLWLLFASTFLLLVRVGLLRGMARAYPNRPWTYWLSPLADLPVVLRIFQFALRRRHSWRGRTYVRRGGGAFEPLAQPD